MKGIIREFKEFAMRGNVIDLAVGIIVGGAFNSIVQSLVKDIVMPPIGFILGKVDLSSLFINLTSGDYQTIAEAQAASAPTINYGLFLNQVIVFIITAFAVFMLVKFINELRKRQSKKLPPPPPQTKKCPFCISDISIGATRCPNCTSTL